MSFRAGYFKVSLKAHFENYANAVVSTKILLQLLQFLLRRSISFVKIVLYVWP